MPDPAGMGRTDRALDDGVISASERAMAQSVKRKLEFPVAANAAIYEWAPANETREPQ
jgi:hypothetical protein